MYCPECGLTNLRYGLSAGALYGDSQIDIYCVDCNKSFRIIEREKKAPIQIEIDTNIWPEDYIRAEDIVVM